jgi:hypothetical protein
MKEHHVRPPFPLRCLKTPFYNAPHLVHYVVIRDRFVSLAEMEIYFIIFGQVKLGTKMDPIAPASLKHSGHESLQI